MKSYIATICHDRGVAAHARISADDRSHAIKLARKYARRIGVKPLLITAIRERAWMRRS